MSWFNAGWFLVGAVVGVFVTIMVAVLSVAHDADEREEEYWQKHGEGRDGRD